MNVGQLNNPHFTSSQDLKHRIMYAASWLSKAMDVCKEAGVSHSYNVFLGWASAYPETTGYIIPTFLTISKVLKQPEYEKRALILGKWLLTIQDGEGWYQAGKIGGTKKPSIFNTGQILFGLNALYQHTGDESFKHASIKAAEWIVRSQEKDGSWRRYVYNQTAHTYYIRVSQALSENYVLYDQSQLKDNIYSNLDWLKGNYEEQHRWLDKTGFKENSTVHLHTIAYAIEGLFQVTYVLGDNDGLEISVNLAEKVASLQAGSGKIPGGFKKYWRPSNYACLTGISQMASVWLDIYRLLGMDKYLSHAIAANSYVMTKQSSNILRRNTNGGISGSHPLWGKYLYFRYPNWAAKFFIDALIEQLALTARIDGADKH